MPDKDPGWLRFYDRLGRFLLLVPAAIVVSFSLISLVVDLVNGQLSGDRLLSHGVEVLIGGVLAFLGTWWHSRSTKRLRKRDQQIRDEFERYSRGGE
jgi:hypothetical protein